MTCLSQLVSAPKQQHSSLDGARKVSFGRRTKRKLGINNFSTGLKIANSLFEAHRYLECFDLYEELMASRRDQSIELLAELYDLYQLLPGKDDRYSLYQARLFDFGIGPTDRVLDVGGGNIPFPLATDLADLCLGDNEYARAGRPFNSLGEVEGFQCDLLMRMHLSPESKREKALTALLYLKADLINTMFLWENSFQHEVRRARPAKKLASNVPPRFSPAKLPDETAPASGVNQQRHVFSRLKGEKRTCLFLNTYYPRFLQEHYARDAHLASATYADQKTSIQSRFFGDCDFYSRALNHFGWSAEDLIVNCDPLQRAWARENCPEFQSKTSLEINV
jgi:hypothetical protein